MTEEHIKEALAVKYIELIAAYNGYKTVSSFPDYGTDLSIIKIGYREEHGHKSYSETGHELKFQLKTTTKHSIIEEEEAIKYDLDAKTYNNLIDRRNTSYPLFLILFVLPREKENWVKLSGKKLTVKKCAYWFFPNSTDVKTNNKSSIRITIKKENVFHFETLNQLFKEYHNE